MRILKKMLVVSFAFLALSNSPDSSAETTFGLGGAELDTQGQSFSYLGAGTSKPISSNYSITGKVFGSYLTYHYDSNGKTLMTGSLSFTPSIGLAFQKDWYLLGGSIGYEFREVERELAAGGSEEISDSGPSLQAEAYLYGQGKKTIELIGSYATIDDFFWMRGRFKKGIHAFGNGADLNIGVELTALGNNDFSATQAGILAEALKPGANIALLIKAGLKNTSALGISAYNGFEVFYGF